MLSKSIKGYEEISERFKGLDFSCEYKYDGMRGQIHYHKGEVEIYSRNMEKMTVQFPELAAKISKAVLPHVKSFIVDSELVAYDQETRKYLPF